MVSARISIPAFAIAVLIVLPAYGQLQQSLLRPDTALPPRVQLSPTDRGDLYMARKMYREAIDAYREGAAKSPILMDKIGIAYHQLGDLNAARKSYQAAIKLNPKYADAINNVGTVLYAQKRYRSAISQYRKALKYSPDAASIWSNLGTAYYARRRYKEMSEAYATALRLDPMVFESHSTVGTEMQDRTVADKARYHYEMALIYAKSGNNDMALQYLRRSLEEGFKDRDKLNKAPEFAGLRETKEFKDLMATEPRVL